MAGRRMRFACTAAPPPGGIAVSAGRRFPTALAVSGLVHALAVAAMLELGVGPARTPVRVFPVSLVASAGGGGGGAGGPATAPVPEEAPVPEPVAPPPPKPIAAREEPRRPSPRPTSRQAPPADAMASAQPSLPEGIPGTGTGSAGNGGGAGGAGDGTGGDGSGGARVAYGTNPLPPYPLAARRLGMEGVTLVDVLVAPDGRPADVRVQKSSGFAPLDESAVRTVRERWRFIPARVSGAPVESRVTVPIRFRLADQGG